MRKPELRIACLSDMPQLCGLAKEFIDESKWGYTYDDMIAIGQFYGYICGENTDILLATFDDEIASAAILCATQDLTKEMQGFVHKFFTSKRYRKTLASVELVKFCNEWFDLRGCKNSYATSTGNISDVAICAYTKLMRKYGYNECGPTLYRVRKDG